MVLSFDQLPEDARVWVYQSNREFSEDEVKIIQEKLEVFLESWTHHGDALNGSAMIKYNQFIVLGIDEKATEASGCSIDSSVFFMKQLETLFNVQLLDRMQTAFKINDSINVVSLSDFMKFVKEGKVSSKTVVFNNLVSTKQELFSQWEVPAYLSWHKRYFN